MEAIKSFLQARRAGIVSIAAVLMAGALLFGVYQAVTYSWPMHEGRYRDAFESMVADEATVQYDAALAAYKAGDFETAKKLLTTAFSSCTNSEGVIPESRKQLGSQIQFLLGNTYVKLEKTEPAVKAYEESLRLDPSNLYTKYNLELLQSQSGGNGGGGAGDPQGPGGAGKGGGKKGI